MSQTCVLCGVASTSVPLVGVVLGVSDQEWSAQLHEGCLNALLAAHLQPLAADRPGHIPANASCGVCGGRLPLVGRHPYFLSTGDADVAGTWFIHAHCLPEELQPSQSES